MSAEAVILIPGIKGSQLINTNTHNFQPVWRDVRFNFQRVEHLELTEQFNGEYYDENLEVLIERGSIESLAYKEFYEDLETDLPKFYFSYDWRRSNRENGERLNDFIEMLKAKSQARNNGKVINKVNIVTHSMGNHICRFYINDFGFNSIHKIAFVAPPFTGSLAMVEAVIRGQGFFGSIKRKLRQLVKTFPGALELFPTYKDAAVFQDGTQVDFYDPKHWQKSVIGWLNDPNDSWEKRVTQKFVDNLAIAKKNISDLDNWMKSLTKSDKERILVIVRDEFKTTQAVNVFETDDNTVDFRGALKNDNGDSVVPHVSSCHYHNDFLTLAVEDALRYDDDRHAFFMTEERVQLLVGWFFDDSRKFDYSIPGKSIKRVSKIKRIKDSKTGLYRHDIVKV